MEGICVATADSRAYYLILSRLRETSLRFASLTPSEVAKHGCDLVITTKMESKLFEGKVVAIEDLDDNPLVMKGQILSRLSGGDDRILLIGIDPGSRIGLAIYYGDSKLAGLIFNSIDDLRRLLARMVKAVPNGGVIVRIGSGSPELSKMIVSMSIKEFSDARIEIVDEKGTSSGPDGGGLKRDQDAAARIAFRKGILYESR